MHIPSSNTKPTLIARNISYETPTGQQLLKDLFVSFSKEKTGFIGKNGSGKSTLLRILVGEIHPTSGSVERFGKIGYLAQDLLSPQQEISTKVTGDFYKLRAQLGLAAIDPQNDIHTLSGGERMKTMIVNVLAQNPDFLILDEPTNNLDATSKSFVYSLISKWPKGLLVVSHDRELLQLVDRILELRSHGIHEYGGNFEFFVEQKRIEQQAQQHQLDHAKVTLRRTERNAKETLLKQDKRTRHGKKQVANRGIPRIIVGAMENKVEQTNAKLKKLHEEHLQQAQQSLEEAQSKIALENQIKIDLTETHVQSGKLVAELKNISFGYSENKILNNVTFSIYGPERIAIQGPNGSGKTTLIKLILGNFQAYHGEVRLEVEQYAYLDQHTSQLLRDKTLAENLEFYHKEYTPQTTRHWLSKFLFTEEDLHKKVINLSGGEKMRAALAIALAGEHPPQLLILDEPTNNLDLATIEQIESALLNYQGALIVISHDTKFLEQILITKTISLPFS